MKILKGKFIMINNFFTYPMRIFFLTSAACAVLGAAIFFTPTDFVSLHKFIFLHLFLALAYAGFLLTGLTDWINFSSSLKAHAYILFSLFATSFIAALFSLFLAHFFITLFWAYLVMLCLYMIWRDKNLDQFGVLGFLFGILGFEIYYLISGNEKFLNLQIYLHIIAILLISYRVSVVLGKEALKREKDMDEAIFVPNFIYKNIAICMTCAFLLFNIFFEKSIGTYYVAIACGCAVLAKLKEWHYKQLLRHNFVIYYYFMQVFLAVGFLGIGVSGLLNLGLEVNFMHLIAVNAVIFSVMLIFNIAGLRHSGQELEFLRLSKIAFILVILAGVSRGILAYFWSGFYIHLPATLIALAFIFWLINFYAIFRDNEFSEDPE